MSSAAHTESRVILMLNLGLFLSTRNGTFICSLPQDRPVIRNYFVSYLCECLFAGMFTVYDLPSAATARWT